MSPSLTSPSRPQQRSPFPPPVLKYQRVQNSDVFTSPGTPRPQFYVTSTTQNPHLNIRQCTSENDTYTVVHQASPEMTRHLRELLQRPQIESNTSDQQTTQPRLWMQGILFLT